MKSPIFLLGTILISAPVAFGQTAPIAVAVPVANAATAPMSGDTQLQTQIDKAAQALAKLPASTPDLAKAQERVAAARASVVVPVGFSLGQSGRSAHLVLDNLRSARVWCQSSAQTDKADEKVLLNDAIELLKGAEKLAQQKVDVLDKPVGRTTEELLASSERILKRSQEILAASIADSAKSNKEADELVRKFQNLLDEQAARNASYVAPRDPKLEEDEAKRQQREFDNLLSVSKSIEARLLRVQEEQENLRLSREWIAKSQAEYPLLKKLADPGLALEQRQKLQSELANAVKATANAKKASSQSSEKIEVLKKSEKLTNPISLPLGSSQVWYHVNFLTSRNTYRLIQNNQPTLEELKTARDEAGAKVDETKAAIAKLLVRELALIGRNETATTNLLNTFSARNAAQRARKASERENTRLQQEANTLAATAAASIVAYRAAQAQVTTANSNLAAARAALRAAQAALAELTNGQCPTPEALAQAQQAVTNAQAAVATAEAEVEKANANKDSAWAAMSKAVADSFNAGEAAKAAAAQLAADKQTEADAISSYEAAKAVAQQIKDELTALDAERGAAEAADKIAVDAFLAADAAYKNAGGVEPYDPDAGGGGNNGGGNNGGGGIIA